MDDQNKEKTSTELILLGVCPEKHDTEEKVCKKCYETLLKKHNNFKNQSNQSSVKKSQWHTW